MPTSTHLFYGSTRIDYQLSRFDRYLRGMSKISILLFLSVVLSATNLSAQMPWQWQGVVPTTHYYYDVQMITDSIAVGVGDAGTFIRSTDAGEHWDYFYTGSPIGLKAMDFVSPDSGFVVGTTYGYSPEVVLRTHDGGLTWTPLTIPEMTDLYATDFISADTGWVAGTGGKILYTTDAGNTWSDRSLPLSMDIKTVFMFDADTGFVAGATTLYKTVNGGLQWSSLASLSNCNQITFYDHMNGIAACDLSIRKTSNGGLTWNSYGEGATSVDYVTSTLVYAASVTSLLKSTNGGNTWTAPNNFYHQAVAIDFHGSNNGVVLGQYGSIQRTVNGGLNWLNVAGEANFNHFNKIQMVNVSTGYCVAEGGVIMRTTDGGQEWTNIGSTTGGTEYNDLYFVNETTGYITGGNKVLKTTNGGTSFTTITVAPSNIVLSAIWFVNASVGWVAGKDGLVYKTTNGGTTWVAQTLPVYTYSILDMCFVNANVGYMGGYGGNYFKTVNGGTTWQSITPNISISDIMSIQFLDENEGWAASYYDGLKHTVDGGTTWTSYNIPCSNPDNFQFINSNVGYYVTDNSNWNCRVYRTTDGGQTWQNLNIPVWYNLLGISAVNQESVYISGEFGTIIHIGSMDYFIQQAAADFDGNGQVGVADLNLLLANFGCISDCDPFDLNNDGIVGTDDVMQFLYVIE